MSKSDLCIDILGTEITITTDEEPEYLDKLLSKYRQTIEKVRQVSGLRDPLKIAVLTGFLLSDDLEKAGTRAAKKEVKDMTASEAEELTLGMISRLDEALKVSGTANTIDDTTLSSDTAVSEERPEENTEEVTEEVTVTIPAPDALYKLENSVKNYDWGSREWLPAFLGEKNLSRIPWAELWLGVNPLGPSRVAPDSCLLSELIEKDPPAFLGEDAAARFGALPFLLKVIAAAKPLSIQVHPNASQAREGFERENREGIPLDAANRNYKDPNQKSEILCALGPFAALCGFREAEEITLLMEILLLSTEISESGLRDIIESLVSALKQEGVNHEENPNKNPIRNFLSALFTLERETLLDLGAFIKAKQPQLQKDFPEYGDEWNLCSYLAALHPGDSGIIAPLYLNILELGPEEAFFIPSGTPHAYINGMGIELLSDSDNVLRGGLTPKHVDHAELMKILDFTASRPEITRPPIESPAPLAGSFVLSVIHGEGTDIPYAEAGPSIILVTEGRAIIGPGTKTVLQKGESAFIPAGKSLILCGAFTAHAAFYRSSCRSS